MLHDPHAAEDIVQDASLKAWRQAFGVDLVRQAQAGDDRAFAALLRPVVPSAYRLAGAMLHDPHAAEDIVQDASLKAWRKLDQFKADTEMQPWFLARRRSAKAAIGSLATCSGGSGSGKNAKADSGARHEYATFLRAGLDQPRRTALLPDSAAVSLASSRGDGQRPAATSEATAVI